MKTTETTLLMELLSDSIEEAIKAGDIQLTKFVNTDPVLLVRINQGPICFSVGWDPAEQHSIFSLN